MIQCEVNVFSFAMERLCTIILVWAAVILLILDPKRQNEFKYIIR